MRFMLPVCGFRVMGMTAITAGMVFVTVIRHRIFLLHHMNSCSCIDIITFPLRCQFHFAFTGLVFYGIINTTL